MFGISTLLIKFNPDILTKHFSEAVLSLKLDFQTVLASFQPRKKNKFSKQKISNYLSYLLETSDSNTLYKWTISLKIQVYQRGNP